jgi:hypothetical protein
MKNRNVAIDNGKVEVGERNVVVMKEKFHSSLIKNPKVVFRPGIDLKEMLATLKYGKVYAFLLKSIYDFEKEKGTF